MKNTISDVLFEEIPGTDGNLGIITLNRPQVLNALNHKMFIAIDEQLAMWENTDTIKAVVIKATDGRAFCAGGDIRHVYERKSAHDSTLSTLFRDEYTMNKRIHHFPKPYIALLDGITMGGGVGVSIHSSHRIATERLIFAMPETSIGFYPDVGTTYFLSRLPHKTGFYLGLTGERITHTDCFAVGLIDKIIARDSLPKIIPALLDTPLPDKSSVTAALKQFAIPSPQSDLMLHQDEIEFCFSHMTIEEIIDTLEKFPSEWCEKTAKILKKKSPTSLKVTLHALQIAEKLNFDSCIQMEYGLTCHFIQGHDFFEGIRATIIDKDQTPHWRPEYLSEVTTQDIAKYFTPLTKELA